MKVIHLYQCEICGRRSPSKEQIERCEARGTAAYPVGLMRAEADRYEGGSQEVYAVAGQLPVGKSHYFFAREILCRTWAFDPREDDHFEPFDRMASYAPSPMTREQEAWETTRRMAARLRSQGIEPLVWDATAGVARPYAGDVGEGAKEKAEQPRQYATFRCPSCGQTVRVPVRQPVEWGLYSPTAYSGRCWCGGRIVLEWARAKAGEKEKP